MELLSIVWMGLALCGIMTLVRITQLLNNILTELNYIENNLGKINGVCSILIKTERMLEQIGSLFYKVERNVREHIAKTEKE